MPTKVIQRLLERLDEAKRRFGSRDAELVAQTLSLLGRQRFSDAESLLQFHELLLFVRAYPASLDVLRQAEALLKGFADRVAKLRAEEADLSSFIHPESSGVAGTSVTDSFSYPIVRWLVTRQTPRVKLAWDWFEDENRLAQSWPRFMPMLEDDAAVEANIPFKDWLGLASGDQKDLVWLIQRFESLRVSEKERTELFDSQKLYVKWTPPYRATRTGMRLPVKKDLLSSRAIDSTARRITGKRTIGATAAAKKIICKTRRGASGNGARNFHGALSRTVRVHSRRCSGSFAG